MAIVHLITGANRGIGLELAHQLTSRGDSVIGTARNPDAASELRDLGARVEQLDVGDPDSVAAIAKRLDGAPIDVLINNAGVFLDREMSLETITPDAMNDTFRINVTGPLLVSRALLPNVEAGDRKLIVQISSTMGCLAQAGGAGGHFAYRSSKSALNMMNLLLSNTIKGRGVASVAVHPGWVQTDMGGSQAHLTVEQSAGSLIKTIDNLDGSRSGAFMDYEGKPLPW